MTNLTPDQIQLHKDHIDLMNQYQLGYTYRFSTPGHPYFIIPEITKHFMDRFTTLGGMTPELSKELGWKPY